MKCRRCGRPLRNPVSVFNQRGPKCARKIKEASRDFKPEQTEKALDLIAEGHIKPFRGQIFVSLSSDGKHTYKTAPMACTCPAGVYRGYHACYHQLAVELIK